MATDEANVTGDATEGVGAITGLDSDRITATIGNWKRKLLDVSKRNRALSFKPNKVTTITIVDEQPTEVFRLLYLQKQQMRFLPAPEQSNTLQLTNGTPADTNVANESAEEIEEYSPSFNFAPYEAADLDARYTDDLLQTSLSPESLDNSLRRIADQARTSIEEQGVNTLFLALGMLNYK